MSTPKTQKYFTSDNPPIHFQFCNTLTLQLSKNFNSDQPTSTLIPQSPNTSALQGCQRLQTLRSTNLYLNSTIPKLLSHFKNTTSPDQPTSPLQFHKIQISLGNPKTPEPSDYSNSTNSQTSVLSHFFNTSPSNQLEQTFCCSLLSTRWWSILSLLRMVVAPDDHPEPRVTSCKSLYTINEPKQGIVLFRRDLFCPPYDGDALHQIEHLQWMSWSNRWNQTSVETWRLFTKPTYTNSNKRLAENSNLAKAM